MFCSGAAHGEICAGLLAASLTVNRRQAEKAGVSLGRIEEVNQLLAATFPTRPGQDGFEALGEWARLNGLRGLNELGLQASEYERIAEASKASSSMRGNMVELSTGDLLDILTRSA